MLLQFPSVRLVCADNGVIGEFRVRDLNPILSRDGDLNTKTRIRENGVMIWTDPAKAYFSARLSNERSGNLIAALKLKNQLGRSLRICDPYAGVGPSLASLLGEQDLISDCYAGDLNPDAFKLLEQNVEYFISKSKAINVVLKNQDARHWQQQPTDYAIDFLMVNLPHDSIDHLPKLLPLLAKKQSTVIRGWAIIEKDEIQLQQSNINNMLQSFGAQIESITCNEVKGFSSTKIFMCFETWQNFS